ncbi:hypothetical protein, partial [Ornithinicoccus halotolerans]|uniref:hypothetical protein n=1 Tax=Ornithinicoccus halotolerans TaxID=1748220 RepID=UPI001E38A5A6
RGGGPGTRTGVEARLLAGDTGGLLRRYRSGERDPHLEDQVVAELSLRGLTPRGRPHLAGLTNANPPLLLFDTDVHPETGS